MTSRCYPLRRLLIDAQKLFEVLSLLHAAPVSTSLAQTQAATLAQALATSLIHCHPALAQALPTAATRHHALAQALATSLTRCHPALMKHLLNAHVPTAVTDSKPTVYPTLLRNLRLNGLRSLASASSISLPSSAAPSPAVDQSHFVSYRSRWTTPTRKLLLAA